MIKVGHTRVSKTTVAPCEDLFAHPVLSLQVGLVERGPVVARAQAACSVTRARGVPLVSPHRGTATFPGAGRFVVQTGGVVVVPLGDEGEGRRPKDHEGVWERQRARICFRTTSWNPKMPRTTRLEKGIVA